MWQWCSSLLVCSFLAPMYVEGFIVWLVVPVVRVLTVPSCRVGEMNAFLSFALEVVVALALALPFSFASNVVALVVPFWCRGVAVRTHMCLVIASTLCTGTST